MKTLSGVLVLCFLTRASVPAQPPEIVALTAAEHVRPQFAAGQIMPDLLLRMQRTSWRPGCPEPLEELRILTISFWDFSGLAQKGILIVNRAVAPDVLFVFQRLFEHGFLIERMQPVEDYDGSDDRSMAANNTSAFNCRDVTGKPGKFSNHSWGRAIDINPLTNPMLLHGKVLPPQGARYTDRSKAAPGSILAGSFIVELFHARGWRWGGEWADPDYQHFEKADPHRP